MRNPSLPSSHATRDKPSSSRPAAVSQMKPGACNELGEVNGEERRLRRGGSLLAQAPCRTPTLWRCRPSTAPTAGQGQSTRRRGPTERPQPCPRCDPAVLGLRMSVAPPQGGPPAMDTLGVTRPKLPTHSSDHFPHSARLGKVTQSTNPGFYPQSQASSSMAWLLQSRGCTHMKSGQGWTHRV